MNRVLTAAALLMTLLSPLAASTDAPVVSLSDALDSAEKNSISLESARIALEMELRKQDAAMTTFMPDLSVSAGVSTGVAFPGTSAMSYGLSGSLTEPAFAGLTVNASANASFSFTGNMITDGETRRLAKESARLSYEDTYDSLEEAIISSYWNIAATDAAIESARLAADDAQAQYESAQEMYDNGLIDELSVIQLEIAAKNAHLNLKTLEDNRALLSSSFRSLTGIEGDFTTEPFPGMTELTLPSAEALFDQYGENTVEIRSARNALATSENAVDTARLSTYVPVISASVGYSYAGSGYQRYKGMTNDYGHSSNAITGSLMVTLPISAMLPGSSSSIAIKDAKDSVRLSSLSLQSAKDNLLETIRENVMQIEQAQESVGMQRSSYTAAQRSYELSQEAFDSGLITAEDLASARNDMLSSELSLLSTELNHLLSCYSLSFALGMDIEELTASYASSEENIQ